MTQQLTSLLFISRKTGELGAMQLVLLFHSSCCGCNACSVSHAFLVKPSCFPLSLSSPLLSFLPLHTHTPLMTVVRDFYHSSSKPLLSPSELFLHSFRVLLCSVLFLSVLINKDSDEAKQQLAVPKTPELKLPTIGALKGGWHLPSPLCLYT